MECDEYSIGKDARQTHLRTFKSAMYNAKFPGNIFTDLMRPITPEAFGGYHYASKFTDASTRWREIYLFNRKSDAVASL